MLTRTRSSESNPYVGPRAFRRGERLYGRDYDLRKLVDQVISQRVVVLVSPSGAGKTSLLDAGVKDLLERMGFQVLPTMRINHAASDSELLAPHPNRFVGSVLEELEKGLYDDSDSRLPDLSTLTLERYLTQRAALRRDPRPKCLIFDQFEEIITLGGPEREEREEFFRQLGDALANPRRWAILSMREEYFAALKPYADLVPTRLTSLFRLELLDRESARKAITSPAGDQGVKFAGKAADKLLDNLGTVPGSDPDAPESGTPGAASYIEPMILQVVCHDLWEQPTLTPNKIRVGDIPTSWTVDSVLGSYYVNAVKRIATEHGVKEKRIMSWFDEALISPHRFRVPASYSSALSNGLTSDVLSDLVDAYLVPLHRDFDRFSQPRSGQMQGAPRRNSRSYCDEAQRRRWPLIDWPGGSHPEAPPRRCSPLT